MAECIEREAVLRDWPLCDEPADAYQYIRSYPAVDVRPVVRGKWRISKYDAFNVRCSECGHVSGSFWNFCPNCGADMRDPPKEG